MSLAESGEAVGVGQNVDAPCYRHINVAVPKCLAGDLVIICQRLECMQPEVRTEPTHFNCGKPRRAGCVNAVAGTREFEEVVDATWSKCTASSWDVVCSDFLALIDFSVVVG